MGSLILGGLVSFIVGVLLLYVEYRTGFFHRLLTYSLTPEQRQHNRRAMLELVRNTWVRDLLEKSLYGAAMIELGLEERADTVEPLDMVLQMPDQPNRPLPAGTKIVQVFDEIGHFLLILGEPGSGKTTMLLELARDTITRAEKDPTQPIPVVFNLSSWTEKQQPIVEWLVDELNAKYYVSEKVARPWVENGDLLLLLDGLDGVKAELRENCVKAINDFRQKHGLTFLVVCSRTEQYEELTTRLKLQGAVVLQPLTPQQIDQYLEGVGTELLAVRRTLQHDTTLQELTQTPLMLSVMTLAYRGMSMKDLGSLESIEAGRRHVFDTYVQRMFERREVDRRYSPEQTIRWLAWLAQKMSRHGLVEFLIERMQAGWLQTRIQRWLYLIIFRLIDGLVLGMGVGLIVGLIAIGDLAVGLIVGLIGGVIGVLIGEVIGSRSRSFEKVGIGLAIGCCTGLISICCVGLILWWLWGLRLGIPGGSPAFLAWGLFFPMLGGGCGFGLLGALAGGLLGALVGGLSSGSLGSVELTEALKWSWKEGGKGLVVGLIVGLCLRPIVVWIFGLIVGFAALIGGLFGELMGGLSSTETDWTSWVLTFGLIGGLGGLIGGLSSAEIETKTTPNQGIRYSAKNAVTVGLIGGLMFGLIAGLMFGLIDGLFLGLFAGLILGLHFGGAACVQHFTLRFILCLNGRIPWNYARFLDYAAECIFLRKVGGRYIFIHGLLQDYFAALDQDQ